MYNVLSWMSMLEIKPPETVESDQDSIRHIEKAKVFGESLGTGERLGEAMASE